MLRNSRKCKESEQEQWLLASAPDAPFSGYCLRLAEPPLELPPCFVQLADPPGKSLVGPYKMTGTLGTARTDPKQTYSRTKYHQLSDVTFEKLSIPQSIPASCRAAVRQQWKDIGSLMIASGIPSTEEARSSSQLPLSDFVRQQAPTLLCLRVDGKQALYCCAEGRKYLSWHGEALARVYCLIDLEQQKPVRIHIETSTYALE
jgi:hypothetical protein